MALGLFAGASFSGCSHEEKTGVFTSTMPDTSFLRIYDLKYTAANDSGRCDPGLNMQWYELFYSNYRKSCAIKRYVLLDPKSDTIFDKEYSTVFIQNKDNHYGITKWIDVEDSSVAGPYSLHILYRHSDTYFRFDTTVFVFPNQTCD